MKRYSLGEFEEIVLLTVGVLYNERMVLPSRRNRNPAGTKGQCRRAAISAATHGGQGHYLDSRHGDSTNVRGGKRKRFFTITAYGKKALEQSKEARDRLWRDIPDVAFDF